MDTEFIRNALREASCRTGAFFTLYIEDRTERSLIYQHELKDLQSLRVQGASLEGFRGENRASAYSGDVSEKGMIKLLTSVEEMLTIISSQEDTPESFLPRQSHDDAASVPGDASAEEDTTVPGLSFREEIGLGIVRNCERTLQEAGLTGSFRYRYTELTRLVRVTTSSGEETSEIQRNCALRLYYTLDIPDEGNRNESIGSISGWTQFVMAAGPEDFPQDTCAANFVDHLMSRLNRQQAKSVPKGSYPVVFSPNCGGTFWHECCGHQLEGNAVFSHASDFEGKIGEAVASELVTLVDDGTLPGAYGTGVYDDEGVRKRRNVLIDRGVLKQYMCDRYHGALLGNGSNGCGRRQDYTFSATCRMSNTLLAPGQDNPEDIVREIPLGLYVKSLGGGSGGKVFSILCTEGYMIRDGKLAEPISECMLSARGSEVMFLVDRVCNDFVMEPSGGSYCGAGSGLVGVTASSPTFRLKEMEVG
ncbi:MAG: TldD/PmbA family protein [Lachnospiraceae bacterium]|nr:TldD/PmbA family protein [Lachnospiraceae bacterium]